jgi:endonuclease/exonuclease/phosphatase family metal-dependent hydrolase
MKLNIISFNIRCCDDPNGYAISERAPRLSSVTSRYDADIIGFQEYYTPRWKNYIDQYYGAEYDMFIKPRAEADFESTPILWKKERFDCLKTGCFWLSDTPEIESRGWDERYNCFRMCVYVILRDKQSDTTFTFMNTHFGFGDKGQVDSAHLIYEYSKKISDYPTVIVGDFNMCPDSAGYVAMTAHFTDLNAVTARDERATFHGYEPEKYPEEHIDYCFVDDKVKPINQKIIDNLVEGMFPSDHYGLHIKLEI